MQPSEERTSPKRRPREQARGSGLLLADLKTSLLCLTASLLLAWLHFQQNLRMTELKEKYEELHEKIRGVPELQARLAEIARRLHAADDVTALRNASAALQEQLESADVRVVALHHQLQRVAEVWRAGAAALRPELSALQGLSRAQHASITRTLNEAEERLRGLTERLQEVEDGARRNTRVLSRTEEEDLRGLQELLEWSGGRVSELQERMSLQNPRLQETLAKLEKRRETRLEAVEEAVRSVLRLRAHVNLTFRRLDDLTLQCEVAHTALSSSKWQDWDHQVSELQERTWTLNLDLQRLQQNLTTLLHTFSSLENQTAATSSEVALKVASVRTDVRRMAGLETEVRQLLSLTHTLEEKVSQSERLMVRRVGEALAGSVQRVSSLKGVVESHAQRLEEMGRRFGEVSSENRRLSERMLALESAQAKLLRTSTFAADLQPKVLSIRQEFADVEPKLSDLTLRIGLLAEDLRWREEQLEHSRDVQQVSRESEASDVLD